MPRPTRARLQETRKILCVISGVFAAILLVVYASQLHWKNGFVRDYDDYVVGVDFVNGWMMGQAAWHDPDPANNYEVVTYNRALRAHFGPSERISQWSYPPSFMLLAALFGWLPYGAALVFFWLASLAAWRWVIRPFAAPDQWAMSLSPAALIAFISGQATFLLTGLQLLVMRWIDRRPVVAGLLIGLLAVKPHVAIAYPFFLIATRRWKVFATAAASSVAVVILSALLWGEESWQAYLQVGAPAQWAFVLRDPTPTVRSLIPTIYMDLRMLGVPYAYALALHALAGMASVAALFHPRRARLAPAAQWLVMATVGIIASPYLMSYDTLFFVVCLVLWLREQKTLDRQGMQLAIGCFFLPVIHFVMGVAAIPGGALLPPLLLVWLLRRKKARA